MTFLVSLFGIVGRFGGDLLTSALGWASSLLFGRVPRSHQIFVVVMMAGSFLWTVLVLSLLIPSIASVLLAATPHPPFVDSAWLGFALLVGVILVPILIGLAGTLVPADGERPAGVAVPREILRGYLLAPVISALLIFLAGVGIVRKVRSRRHGWSDTHVPIVVKPGGYDRLVVDLQDALATAALPTTAQDAPWVLTLPAQVLTRVAGGNVRSLRPDRLVELTATAMRIGIYPSDIAISGGVKDRTRARAAILSRLATTSAHLTTSAEAQGVEDRIGQLRRTDGVAGAMSRADDRAKFATIDADLLALAVPTDEWDILYRLRLQMERDLLVGADPGTAFPGHERERGEVAVSQDPIAGDPGTGGQRHRHLAEPIDASPSSRPIRRPATTRMT